MPRGPGASLGSGSPLAVPGVAGTGRVCTVALLGRPGPGQGCALWRCGFRRAGRRPPPRRRSGPPPRPLWRGPEGVRVDIRLQCRRVGFSVQGPQAEQQAPSHAVHPAILHTPGSRPMRGELVVLFPSVSCKKVLKSCELPRGRGVRFSLRRLALLCWGHQSHAVWGCTRELLPGGGTSLASCGPCQLLAAGFG